MKSPADEVRTRLTNEATIRRKMSFQFQVIMSQTNISIKKMPVSQLLDHVDRGCFAIPKLQREFVWDGPKSAKLLDSMYKHMPIGVVLVWETPQRQRLELRQKYHVLPAFNPKNPNVWFLIDGQQRISVLHHVKEGSTLRNAKGIVIDFSRVVMSLNDDDDQHIHYRKPLADKFVSLSAILHPHWKSKLSHLSNRQKERVQRCRERILKYPFHLMMIDAKIDQIRETFLRINTQGMKVTTADAIFTRAEELDLRDFRHEVQYHLDDSFRNMSEMPILFAMAVVRGATEARGSALTNLIKHLEQEAQNDSNFRATLAKEWNRLSPCFGKAVDYLRQNFKVLNRDFLYSDYMISMLALFYYWNGYGPSGHQKDQIKKWFWATSIGSRYSGRNFMKCLPEDIKFFKELVEKSNKAFSYKPQTEKSDVRKAQYGSRTGITSAFYCLLLKKGPVSILDNGLNEIPPDRYSTPANRKDRHHIFPKAVLNKEEIHAKDYNSICNICLLTAEENQSIAARRPWSYLGDVKNGGGFFNRKMARHIIPEHVNSGIWLQDIRRGFYQFIKERGELLCEALEAEAGIRLFRRDL